MSFLNGRMPSDPRPWWAGTRLDAWLAAGLVVLSLATALAAPATAPYHPVDLGTLLLAALGPAALVWRQTAPLVAPGGRRARGRPQRRRR